MIFNTNWRRLTPAILLTACCIATAIAQSAAPQPDADLQAVIVLMRHGVRTPIESETRSGLYNAQPWPAWPTPPGVLTPHGAEALHLLGEFYRARYAPLLESTSCEHPEIFVEANTTQRTIASAKAVLTGLSPQCKVEVHSLKDLYNPLFSPSNSPAVDRQRIVDATMGRIGNQPEWFNHAFDRQLEKLHRILTECSGPGCKPSVPDFRTAQLPKTNPAVTDDPRSQSIVTIGADFAENFLLQYTEGLPMSEVGWGRVSRADLDDLMQMNTQYHDFMLRTPYEAQVGASYLAAHLRDTILSAASGKPTPDELGTPTDRFILLDGHDSNLSWLGGLLHLDWLLPDQTFNATPPGSALVFEVRRSRTTGSATVNILFISQTLDQIRNLTSLTIGDRPSIAPIFIPGCSGQGPGYACPVEQFSRIVNSSIDPSLLVTHPGPATEPSMR